MRYSILCVFFGVFLGACSYNSPRSQQIEGDATATVTDFAWLQSNLFQADCVRCHGSTASVNLSSYASITEDSRLINRDAPSQSLLLQIIEQGTMPPSGKLSHELATTVLACWLELGALKDDSTCIKKNSLDATPANPNTKPTSPPGNPGNGGGDQGDDGDDDGDHDNDHDDDDHDDEGDDDDHDDDDDEGNGTVTPPGPGNPQPTFLFADVDAQVLTPHCISCHQGAGASAGIDLTSYEAIISIDGLVVPQNGAGSLLYSVVDSGYMPFGAPLSTAQIQLIKTWIDEGANP